MEQPYSFLADCLSKFHMASEPIQALWIVATVSIVLGVAWLAMQGAVEIARIRHRVDERLKQPPVASGITENASLLREALKALIERESAHRLARLGGTEPDLSPIPRRGTDLKLSAPVA
jgi:hypothetical protein